MLLWFIGGGFTIVWFVFHDRALPALTLTVGVLAPDVIDGVAGRLVTHSVVIAVGVMIVAMLATIGRRQQRKRLLMVPFGMMLHLVLDGVFSSTDVFWWPLTGAGSDHRSLPSLDRPWWMIVAMELLGLWGIVAFARRREEV